MPPRPMGCIGLIISATKWLPVLVTCSIFTWGWYAYTLQLVIFSMQSLVQQIICLIIFNIVFIFSFWSYIQTIFTPNGKIPNKFYLTPEISEDLAKATNGQQKDEILAYVVKRNDLPVSCRTYDGGIRFCEKCNLIKPDRCHHCSICGICILKMDHHCPWINNCVSFNNYKFFVLFLGYTFALCIFVAATTFPYFLQFWVPPQDNLAIYKPATNNTAFEPPTAQELPNNTIGIGVGVDASGNGGISTDSANPNAGLNPNIPFSTRFHILFLFFVSAMLSFGVMFLYCYHVYLLINNRSTLESFRPPLMTYGPDRNAFNLGRKENLNQLFGRTKLLWAVPVFTTEGSGLTYDQRPQLNHGDEEVRQELLNHNQNNRQTDQHQLKVMTGRSNGLKTEDSEA